jgi:hypothetical protein
MAVGLAEFKTTFLTADSLKIKLNQRCPDTPTFFVKEAPFVASPTQNSMLDVRYLVSRLQPAPKVAQASGLSAFGVECFPSSSFLAAAKRPVAS